MTLDTTTTPALILPSGLRIDNPLGKLSAFCVEEYPYYDGVPDADPDRVLPVDVMVTIAVNSYVTRADQVRTIHRGMAARCDRLLAEIPRDADLLGDAPLAEFRRLIHEAVQVRGVLIAVATKVLHRKRPAFIPMLDSVVLKHYLKAAGRPQWLDTKAQSGATAAEPAMLVLEHFREDLSTARKPLEAMRSQLARQGFPLTPVRMLEILVWNETQRYYR